MSNNPYAQTSFRKPQRGGGRAHAKSQISGPAISLIVVSIICLVLVAFGIVFDVIILATGFTDEMIQPRGMPKSVQVMIRMAWGLLLMVSNTVVLIGAIKMLQLKNYEFARISAIISVIPCVGPCCVLGIPFGIWALVVMGRPEIKNAFH